MAAIRFRGPVEVSVVAERQPCRVSTICAVSQRTENVEQGKLASASDLENCSFVVRTAGIGCAVKVAIHALHQRRLRVFAVGVIETVQRDQFTRRADLKDRAIAGNFVPRTGGVP